MKFYANDPYKDFKYWNATAGDLTNKGKLQSFQLGQYTRKRYQDFIPLHYSKTDFRVQVSSTDRTFMSAAAHVAALYPPLHHQVWKADFPWQPIPVRPAEKAVLTNLMDCKGYLDVRDKLFSEAFAQRDKEILDYISEHSGTEIAAMMDAVYIFDALYVEDLANYVLPEWTKSVYPEPLKNFTMVFYDSYIYSEEMRILSIGPFFNAVIEHFEAFSADPTSVPKHIQFCGHDMNIVAILSSIGAFEPHMPYFASSLYLELREGKTQNYINIYYSKGVGTEPEPITVTGCEFNCKLQDFKRIVKDVTITPDKWYPLCNGL